ncbi:putative ATP-grasp enzyme [Cylindrospermum stagnale PCC 7417]|uniref:ATP-grasp domain protein n=1 Tax=Cylindrospermum stagnale PCC 7417 TaxID=56107 RepID=K9WV30_9NOST|nr:putative ATP-grasp enzyme [Cylindrospermum stagnale]AFZ23631.1 putative ATP-grasp enzyme [Cylindrospermum stagnale PCC 7417]ANS54019.1 ATP-grasp domain protein [Cylindrospermum stagnale PCC 7417]
MKEQILAIFQNLGTLALLAIAFPFNCTVVLASLLWNFFSRSDANLVVLNENPQNILIGGGRMTKTLQLARSFHAAGHRVILFDLNQYWFSGYRFSNSVAGFYTVPDSQEDLEGYTQAVRAIAKKENIDFFVPVGIFAASYFDSERKPVLSGYCENFHFDADTMKMLDNKFTFAETARSLSLSVPKTFLITDPEQVLKFDFANEKRKYILKSIIYDSVLRLDLTKLPMDSPEKMALHVKSKPISQDKPWILQEFIPGTEYCTHSTVRNGELTVHCCCKSSAFQVNYENVECPEIEQWVSHFVKELQLTGQISFDFIQAEDGTIYALECNARTHSAITMYYNHPGLADAYLSKEPPSAPLQPLSNSKPTYWLYHELWRLNKIRSLKQLQKWFTNILRGKDAIFEINDPLPFLMVHHWYIPLLLLDSLRSLRTWVRIDFCIGKLIQFGEDIKYKTSISATPE